jgi:hypothetical protein
MSILLKNWSNNNMNQRQAGRRSFLSSIAVLSAGVAFGGRIFTPGEAKHNSLEQRWKYFCEYNCAESFLGNVDVVDHKPVEICSGHMSKMGASVSFPHKNMIAQPVWIYWRGEKQPSDVVIILAEKNNRFKSIRIDRFELEAACFMHEEKNEEDVLGILVNRKLKSVKAKILDNTNVRLSGVAKNKQYSFSRELNYHI